MIHKNTEITLYLIRHAESKINTRPEIVAGASPNTPLTSLGKKQAIDLGQKLKKEKVIFDYVYSSPFLRSVETSRIACNSLGFPIDTIKLVDALAEFSQGEWEGHLRSEIYSQENLKYINTKGSFFVPPSGESQRSVERRISNWFEDEILYNEKLFGKKTTLGIFSHGMAIKCFLHYVMNFDDRLIHRIKVSHTNYCKLRFTEEGWFIDGINIA